MQDKDRVTTEETLDVLHDLFIKHFHECRVSNNPKIINLARTFIEQNQDLYDKFLKNWQH